MEIHFRADQERLSSAAGAWAAGPNTAEQAEITAVQSASARPLRSARRRTHAGGRALSFGYEKNASTNGYEVTVSASSGLSLVQVDPTDRCSGRRRSPRNAIAKDGRRPALTLYEDRDKP